MVDLNATAIFVGVVEAGSFTGGAKSLGLPKGSVSRKISALEAELGARLLNRTTRKLSLTEVGRAYYDLCRKGLREIEAASRVVGDFQAEPRGVLRISAPADSGGGALGDWISGYLKRFDKVAVELVLSDQYVDLIDQRIDLAIRAGRLRDSSFVARKLAASRRLLVASPGYLERRSEPATLEELQTHDCVIHGDSVEGATWILEGPGGHSTLPIRGRVAAHNMGLVLNATVAGLGVGLVPETLVRSEIERRRLVHILDLYASPEQGLYAIYPSSRQISTNVRAFLDLVVEMIDERDGL